VSFTITILGSSGALPAHGRFPSSQLIEIQSRYFLVDCGEGAQMQLKRYELNLHRINHIFISHLHGDHFLGLMGLLFSMHLNKRTTELHVYGHKGLDEIITVQLRYSKSALLYPIKFHVIEPNTESIIYEDEKVTVITIPLLHKIHCSGFLFREKEKPRRIDKEKLPDNLSLQQLAGLKSGHDVTDDNGSVLFKNTDITLSPKKSRSYAYCSDTDYHPVIINQIKNVDILYHEATFAEEDVVKARETKHSTAAEAGLIASKAEVSKLLLGHFSARYKDLTILQKEAQRHFQHTELAIEGETFTIHE
jgi:ribonuclease Z